MTNLIFRPWTEGGTGVTNFDLTDIDLYKEAVRQYGDLSLVVSNVPMPPMNIGGSLHYTQSLSSYSIVDLSQFWDIFRQLKESGWNAQLNAFDRAMKGVI